MKNKLVLLFVSILLIKLVSVFLVGYVQIQPDSSIFIEISKGFLNFDVLKIYEELGANSFPLYPLIISPVFLLPQEFWFSGVMIINSILYSLVIFPIYFILKDLKVKRIFEITFIIALLPAMFFYPNFIMAENLFIPLFLASFYFLITADKDSTAKNVGDIIEELKSGKFANIAERSGRAQDAAGGGGLEELRREGYM